MRTGGILDTGARLTRRIYCIMQCICGHLGCLSICLCCFSRTTLCAYVSRLRLCPGIIAGDWSAPMDRQVSRLRLAHRVGYGVPFRLSRQYLPHVRAPSRPAPGKSTSLAQKGVEAASRNGKQCSTSHEGLLNHLFPLSDGSESETR